jgi:hypothetical protein
MLSGAAGASMEALCRGARVAPGRGAAAAAPRRAAACLRAALPAPRCDGTPRRAPRAARLRAPRSAGDGAVVGGASASAPVIAAALTPSPSLAAPPAVDLRFDNAADANCTTVELVGDDTAGLLAGVLAAFATLGVQVVTGSIATQAGAVRDTFLVTGADGGKLPEEELGHVRGVRTRVGAAAARACGGAPRLPLECRAARECTFPPLARSLYLLADDARSPRRARAARAPQIREHVLASLRLGAGHSGQPLIYGVSAALEVAALKAKRKARGAAADAASPAPAGEARAPWGALARARRAAPARRVRAAPGARRHMRQRRTPSRRCVVRERNPSLAPCAHVPLGTPPHAPRPPAHAHAHAGAGQARRARLIHVPG